jgi:hypothetical protein
MTDIRQTSAATQGIISLRKPVPRCVATRHDIELPRRPDGVALSLTADRDLYAAEDPR